MSARWSTPRRSFHTGAAVAAVLALVGAACGSGGTAEGSGTGGAEVGVVAGFYPLAEAAERVGGDRVEVRNLTPVGAEPHDLELASRDVDRIEDADLVLYLGGGFQPAVEQAVERTGGEALDLLDEGEDDPHVWLDPQAMQVLVERVRDALVDLDPDHAAAYRAGATAYLDDLRALDGEFAEGLARCERRLIVTAHGAFGHLARRYGLEQEAIAGLDPESEPDPRRLAELIDRVRSRGVTTIFSEALVSPEVAEALAREAGVATAVLDPIEGLSDERLAAGDDYLGVMRQNLSALRSALGCS